MSDIHSNIGNDLQGFGGLLRCSVCGNEKPLGDIGQKLKHGWPTCCGYTMTWLTASQLADNQEEAR